MKMRSLPFALRIVDQQGYQRFHEASHHWGRQWSTAVKDHFEAIGVPFGVAVSADEV
jgi:hypothetical protein